MKKGFWVMAVLFIIAVTGFVYYYFSATAAISATDDTISTLRVQVLTLQGQLTSVNSQLATQQSQLSAANSQVPPLQNSLSSAKSQISSLQNDVSSYKGQVSVLQGDISSYKSQVTSLQTDISSYKSQVASLQSQLQSSASANISALQDQVLSLLLQNQDLTDISKLTKVSVKADQVAINQSGRGLPVAKFTADYAGYVLVSGQSTASDSYITVEDSFPGYPLNTYNYPFGTSATLVIPVLPGTVTVTYGIPISGGASTGTISVRYYY